MLKLGVDDLPKPWRAPLTLASFAGVVILTYLAIVAGIRNLARAEAREVERDTRAEFKKDAIDAATNAAREGAQAAVASALTPIAKELAQHIGSDDERDRAQARELERLRGKIEEAPGRAPRRL